MILFNNYKVKLKIIPWNMKNVFVPMSLCGTNSKQSTSQELQITCRWPEITLYIV